MNLLSNTSSGLTSLFATAAVLLLLVGVLLAVLSFVRRKMRSDVVAPRDFSLTDLRQLHRDGKISDEEFDRAKAMLVGKVHSNLAKDVKPSLVAKPLGAELKPDDPGES